MTGLVVIGVTAAVAPQVVAVPVLNAAGFSAPGVMASTYLPTYLPMSSSLQVETYGIIDIKSLYRLCRGRSPRLDRKCGIRGRVRHPPERGSGRSGRGGGHWGGTGCWGGGFGDCCWKTVSVVEALSC